MDATGDTRRNSIVHGENTRYFIPSLMMRGDPRIRPGKSDRRQAFPAKSQGRREATTLPPAGWRESKTSPLRDQVINLLKQRCEIWTSLAVLGRFRNEFSLPMKSPAVAHVGSRGGM